MRKNQLFRWGRRQTHDKAPESDDCARLRQVRAGHRRRESESTAGLITEKGLKLFNFFPRKCNYLSQLASMIESSRAREESSEHFWSKQLRKGRRIHENIFWEKMMKEVGKAVVVCVTSWTWCVGHVKAGGNRCDWRYFSGVNCRRIELVLILKTLQNFW